MSRTIPRVTKDEAFKLWLEGCSYRKIHEKTGMSLGAINQLCDEARRKSPDLDHLRELNIVLSKGDSSVFDAIRGGRLLDMMNRMDVGIDQMDGYVKLSERLSSEHGVDAEGFVNSALNLMRLEGETGRTYGEIIKDFEGKMSEASKLEAKKGNLKGEIQELGTEKAKLEAELTETKKGLTQIVQELKRTISVKKRLEKMGLEKLNALAEFVEDYEALGFNAQEVKKLAEWRKSLTTMNINPDELQKFVNLRVRISKQERELKDEGKKLAVLRAEVKRLWDKMSSLQGRISRLSKLDIVLEKGKVIIPCKLCGVEAVFVGVPSRLVAGDAITRGLAWSLRCAHCGQCGQYGIWDIMTSIAWLVLP